ncbi:MAG TPA: hypothetical protein VGO34_15020 [Alphaproteobacteria bacterium]
MKGSKTVHSYFGENGLTNCDKDRTTTLTRVVVKNRSSGVCRRCFKGLCNDFLPHIGIVIQDRPTTP